MQKFFTGVTDSSSKWSRLLHLSSSLLLAVGLLLALWPVPNPAIACGDPVGQEFALPGESPQTTLLGDSDNIQEEPYIPTYKIRWDVSVYDDLSDSQPCYVLTQGADCQLLQAYATDKYHLLRYMGKPLYVPIAAVDLSGSGVEYRYFSGQDMRTLTGFTGEELERCLQGGMTGLGEAFAQAEKDHGVNALFMIAIAQHESAHGDSYLARYQNNLIGLKSRSGWASFSSAAECVDYLGSYLMNNYLDPEGGFYHGSTIAGVSITYCDGSSNWVRQVGNYMQKDLNKILGE